METSTKTPLKGNEKTSKMIEKLIALSKKEEYDVFNDIIWPETLIDGQYWISPSLLTVHKTKYESELSGEQLQNLSKWECINFFSLNVNGIRDLIVEISKFIHSEGFEDVSEYFHYFIKEENEHMYYFAKFSKKYGNKIYKDKWMSNETVKEADIKVFLVFVRIVSFECLVDYFNNYMAKDETLNPFIRQINALHHKDESRHIAFGVTFVKELFKLIEEKYGEEKVAQVREYVKEYIRGVIELLYNPIVYKDAGISDPYKFRTALLNDPARKEFHNQLVNKCFKEFINNNIITQELIF